uniref:Uncharacterized protein n=1 Tax=Amphimedon queenslandica TaxID=400682 RepID=A0A1X7SFW5_AMPQE
MTSIKRLLLFLQHFLRFPISKLKACHKSELNVAQKAKSSLESQLEEMTTKLEEEMSMAAKAAEREAAKLQQRSPSQ